MLVCQYFGEIPIQIHSVFSRQVSLCKLGWHQTHRDLSTRASWVLGSKVCITTLSQGFYFWYFWDLLLLRAYMYIHTAFLPACLFLLIPLFLFLLSHLSLFFILSSPRPLSCFLGQDLGMCMCPGFAWIVEPSHSMAVNPGTSHPSSWASHCCYFFCHRILMKHLECLCCERTNALLRLFLSQWSKYLTKGSYCGLWFKRVDSCGRGGVVEFM